MRNTLQKAHCILVDRHVEATFVRTYVMVIRCDSNVSDEQCPNQNIFRLLYGAITKNFKDSDWSQGDGLG